MSLRLTTIHHSTAHMQQHHTTSDRYNKNTTTTNIHTQHKNIPSPPLPLTPHQHTTHKPHHITSHHITSHHITSRSEFKVARVVCTRCPLCFGTQASPCLMVVALEPPLQRSGGGRDESCSAPRAAQCQAGPACSPAPLRSEVCWARDARSPTGDRRQPGQRQVRSTSVSTLTKHLPLGAPGLTG